MHAISFALKRGHLRTVAIGQRMLEKIVPGMTPARFDLLYCLRWDALQWGKALRRYINGEARLQRELAAALGLHKSTISKMVARLEELGWVTRERAARERAFGDRRTKLVVLTKAGRRAIAKAMRVVFRQRLLARPYDRIARLFHPTRISVSKALATIYETVNGIARFMGDRSTVWYDGGTSRDADLVIYHFPPPIAEYVGDLHDWPQDERDDLAPPRKRIEPYDPWSVASVNAFRQELGLPPLN